MAIRSGEMVEIPQPISHFEQQFLDLEYEWMNAWKNKDEKLAREIIADDFTLTSSLTNGELMDKEGWIEALGYNELKNLDIRNINVNQYGTVVVANCWYTMEATNKGNDWSGDFVITDVWVDNGKRWQVVKRHATWLQRYK